MKRRNIICSRIGLFLWVLVLGGISRRLVWAEPVGLVKDVVPGVGTSNPRRLAAVGNCVYFLADDQMHGTGLWKSDGTEAGTILVWVPNPDYNNTYLPENFVGLGNLLFFTFNDRIHGTELYRSDGTTAGTYMVKDIRPGADGSLPMYMTAVGNTLYFTATDQGTVISRNDEPWISDGTPEGTVMLKEITVGSGGSGAKCYTFFKGAVYFWVSPTTAGSCLWKTDGTSAGTVAATGTIPYAVGLNNLMAAGEKLYYAGSLAGSTIGIELFASDGTDAGTGLVKDILPGSYLSSNPQELTAMGGKVYFSANTFNSDRELHRSDGTYSGTYLVKDLSNVPLCSNPQSLTVSGNLLFFHAALHYPGHYRLHISDGTEGGTVLATTERDRLFDVDPATSNREYANRDGVVYFRAVDVNAKWETYYLCGRELCRSNGTDGGTRMIRDIYPGPDNSDPEELTIAGEFLFFVANDGTHGKELWAMRLPKPLKADDGWVLY